jgi:hypothetical protein
VQYDLQSDTANGDLEIYSSGYTGTGARQASAVGLIANTNATGGLSLAAQANAPIRLYTGGITSAEVRMAVSGTGQVSIYGLSDFANNAAAAGGGLAAGDLYIVTGSDPAQLAIVV